MKVIILINEMKHNLILNKQRLFEMEFESFDELKTFVDGIAEASYVLKQYLDSLLTFEAEKQVSTDDLRIIKILMMFGSSKIERESNQITYMVQHFQIVEQ